MSPHRVSAYDKLNTNPSFGNLGYYSNKEMPEKKLRVSQSLNKLPERYSPDQKLNDILEPRKSIVQTSDHKRTDQVYKTMEQAFPRRSKHSSENGDDEEMPTKKLLARNVKLSSNFKKKS